MLPDETTPEISPRKNDTLRTIVDLRQTLQKNRIAFGNRRGAIERGVDKASTDGLTILERWEDRFLELEKEADKDIRSLCKHIEIIDYMIEVKGVGPLLSAKVVSMIDIERASTVSALWKYAGYAVNKDGERDRPVKGEKLSYNKRLKTTCYLVGESFIKSNSPYRAIYDNAKEFYTNTKPDWTKLHCHHAAIRKMLKLWLSHLWIIWRELEGLPVTMPYAHEKLGHEHYMKPQEFGWSEVAEKSE